MEKTKLETIISQLDSNKEIIYYATKYNSNIEIAIAPKTKLSTFERLKLDVFPEENGLYTPEKLDIFLNSLVDMNPDYSKEYKIVSKNRLLSFGNLVFKDIVGTKEINYKQKVSTGSGRIKIDKPSIEEYNIIRETKLIAVPDEQYITDIVGGDKFDSNRKQGPSRSCSDFWLSNVLMDDVKKTKMPINNIEPKIYVIKSK